MGKEVVDPFYFSSHNPSAIDDEIVIGEGLPFELFKWEDVAGKGCGDVFCVFFGGTSGRGE